MRILLTFLIFPALARAQSPDRAVDESVFDDYDLESMKSGEFTIQETVIEKPGEDGKAVKSGHRDRKACVKADKEKVWIEISSWGLEAKKADSVTLCEVDRKSRKVLKAWVSEKGAVGVEAKVEAPEPPAESGKPKWLSGANSASRAQENVTAGKRVVPCDGLKMDWYHPDKDLKTIHESLNVWFSAAVPFRLRLDDEAVRWKYMIAEDVNRDLKVSKALVKWDSSGEVEKVKSKETRSVVDFGTDAKPVVKTK
ncbi:MAG: hypothetical protein FD180_3442 [Planctomycetota bacterium]|nr:MAG: hypothetical protein FD180_3442 [Planctomycetota bacterium]